MFKPAFRITPRITRTLLQIEAARQAIAELPIDVAMLKSLRETARLATTHYSTQIEGNRLALPEVRNALAGARFPDRARDEAEVKNHFKALELMEALARRPGPVTEDQIRRLHGLIMTGRNKGTPYRRVQNVIRDASSGRIVYLPPEAKDVAPLMTAMAQWINVEIEAGEWPVPIIAGLAHYQFATIHPYIDGNGRTARLLTTLILHKAGFGLKGIYSLDEYYAKNLPAYYKALTVGPTHNYHDGRAEADVTPFIDYFCSGMADAFSKVRAAAQPGLARGVADQSATLRDIDPRQRRLLELFRDKGSVTAAEMAGHLDLAPRTLTGLARAWITSGFLEYQSAARKTRSYKLGMRYLDLIR
jgi:Fic family protein